MAKTKLSIEEQYRILIDGFRKQFNPTYEISIPLPSRMLSANGRWHAAAKSKAISDHRTITKCEMAKALKGLRPHHGLVKVHHVWFYGLTPYEKCLRHTGRPQKRNSKGKLVPVYTANDKCRPRDEDNAIFAVKPAKDGLADAGLVKSDSSKHVKTGEFLRLGTDKENLGMSGILLFIEVLS